MVVPLTGASSSSPDPRALTYGAPLQILVTAPSSYPNNDTVPSSITPAWRSATWHVPVGQNIVNNADVATIEKAFKTAHDAAQVLRNVAPNSGVSITSLQGSCADSADRVLLWH